MIFNNQKYVVYYHFCHSFVIIFIHIIWLNKVLLFEIKNLTNIRKALMIKEVISLNKLFFLRNS